MPRAPCGARGRLGAGPGSRLPRGIDARDLAARSLLRSRDCSSSSFRVRSGRGFRLVAPPHGGCLFAKADGPATRLAARQGVGAARLAAPPLHGSGVPGSRSLGIARRGRFAARLPPRSGSCLRRARALARPVLRSTNLVVRRFVPEGTRHRRLDRRRAASPPGGLATVRRDRGPTAPSFDGALLRCALREESTPSKAPYWESVRLGSLTRRSCAWPDTLPSHE